MRAELDEALARVQIAEEQAQDLEAQLASRGAGISIAPPGEPAAPVPDPLALPESRRRRGLRRGGAKGEGPEGELAQVRAELDAAREEHARVSTGLGAETSRRAQAEERAAQAELKLSELEGRLLELEFARAVAQERVDQLTQDLGHTAGDEPDA